MRTTDPEWCGSWRLASFRLSGAASGWTCRPQQRVQRHSLGRRAFRRQSPSIGLASPLSLAFQIRLSSLPLQNPCKRYREDLRGSKDELERNKRETRRNLKCCKMFFLRMDILL